VAKGWGEKHRTPLVVSRQVKPWKDKLGRESCSSFREKEPGGGEERTEYYISWSKEEGGVVKQTLRSQEGNPPVRQKLTGLQERKNCGE